MKTNQAGGKVVNAMNRVPPEEKMLYQNKYRIESTRLQNWDYSNDGYYYITICVKNRVCAFGKIVNGMMILSDGGIIADKYWREIPGHFPFTRLDEYVIMPNHIHGIIVIEKDGDGMMGMVGRDKALPCLYGINGINRMNGDGNRPGGAGKTRFQNQGKGSISAIIGSYKSICTKTINQSQNNIPFTWQPKFYDHLIRDEKDLNRIRNYIQSNPLYWDEDEENQG